MKCLFTSDGRLHLRTYAQCEDAFLQIGAAQGPADLKAVEAVPDILALMQMPPSYKSDHAAVALAKIGDSSSFPHLLEYCKDPRRRMRHAVVIILNSCLDTSLWDRIQIIKAQGLDYKPANLEVAALRLETGMKRTLHPMRASFLGSDKLQKGAFPRVNSPKSPRSLRDKISEVVRAFGDPGHIETIDPYSYVFDDGSIHILPVSEAVELWESKLLSRIDAMNGSRDK